ncbi:MAG TPA: hypothetical protein VNO30_13175 [Kofleriaceae bacterium]|nr:hypothetical protein [Kofleriaceae bacterium]
MIDWLRSVGRRLAESPGWQLVIGAAVLALAFPSRVSGTVGLAALAGALGVGVALAWPQLPAWVRTPPAQTSAAIVVAVVVMLGLATFWETLTVSPDWQGGDWGPQHAVLARVMPALPGTGAPVWNHAVGTGDAPLELYPSLGYLVTGHAALALGLEDDLPLAMMVVAVLVHLLLAVATALIAMRVAPRPIALIVGALALVDSGAVAHGGTVGLFRWALLHSALSLALFMIAALGILGALRRPRTGSALAIWIGTALACAAHPAGLLGAAAALVALAAVALLAHDVPPRRALAAMGHVALGLALGAAAWMPLATRILEYGQHFPNPVRTPARLLEDLLAAPSPTTAFAMLSYAGYFGILAGLWSRRAAPVYVSATALVLLTGLCDAPYLALGLAPGTGVARLGTERLAQLARPFLAAAGAYGLAIFFGPVIAGWRGASRNRRLLAAAVIGVFTGALVRALPALWDSASARAFAESRVLAPDPAGRAQLTAWARARAAELGPDAWARAMFESDTHEHFHLTAETGLPSFHLLWQPDLLLRERIEDASPASLARFNVRWVIAQGRSPTLGDPATEQALGTFRIRALAGWDGQFARIERGAGTVRVTRLDDRAVEIDVAAAAPVLVALGTGFYPRWRARHGSGAAAPVYALPSHPGASLHVVAAWVAPGRTTFTADGPLPSDGRGLPLAALALLVMALGSAAWAVPRWRVRILRHLARLRARARRLARPAVRIGVPLALVALVARGCRDEYRPALALELGAGLRGTATVEARGADGAWHDCGYTLWTGGYVCPGLAVAYDAMAGLLNDAPPSWAFNTPAIAASAFVPGVELRVRLRERLAGRYWMAASEGTARLAVSGEPGRDVDRTIVDYADTGDRSIELRAAIPTAWWSFTFVREDTLFPPREHLRAPPDEPPPELGAR